jgi:hypothetical protein
MPRASSGAASAAQRPLRVVILTRSARNAESPAWGLGVDARVVEQVLREMHAGAHVRIESIDHMDPLSFVGGPRKPRHVDVQIHLEVPCRAAWPWARANLVVVNPEWWPRAAWDWVTAPVARGGADMFLFKSHHARALFPEVESGRTRVVQWRAGPEIQTALSTLPSSAAAAATSAAAEFLFLVGASANKLAAAHVICRAWRASWPPLRVVGTDKVLDLLRPSVVAGSGTVLQPCYPSDAERIAAQAAHAFHVVASEAEGFGYTFAEAASLGALPLWTRIPVYDELWGPIVGSTGRIEVGGAGAASTFRDTPRPFTEAAVVTAVEGLLSLDATDAARLRGALRHAASTRIREFRHDWRALMGTVAHRLSAGSSAVVRIPHGPLAAEELPHVAVLTITRNRPRWFANMARNILLADYPTDKLTWVIVDDGDAATGGRVDEAVARFQSANPRVAVRYVSLPRPLPLGAKRNRACEAAPADATVFVMMDDDDHYPKGSIAARVAWLKSTGAGCVYCSTLPMYDCKNYISAVNVPPLDLAPEERVSEATLCFKREFWVARPFPAAVSVAEGEGFLAGRVAEAAEIPPEGVIVSFLHGANATSRRVPDATEPNGCHYGFDDDFFTYISGLAAPAVAATAAGT